MPPRRDRALTFELPKIASVNDLALASSAILEACATGTLSPGEAAEVMSLIAAHVRMLEMTEIEARLVALEKNSQ